MYLTVILKNGQRYAAASIIRGTRRWVKDGQHAYDQGLWFYCTDSMQFFPISEIERIEF